MIKIQREKRQLMHTGTFILLLELVALGRANALVANRNEGEQAPLYNMISTIVATLVSKLYDSSLSVLPLLHTCLDLTALGKFCQVARPAWTNLCRAPRTSCVTLSKWLSDDEHLYNLMYTKDEAANQLDTLAAFAEENGFLVSGSVEFACGSRGRGVFASQDLYRSTDPDNLELVFYVPFEGSALCVATDPSIKIARMTASSLHRSAGIPKPLAEFAARTGVPSSVRLGVLLHWEVRNGLSGSLYAKTLPTKAEYTNAILFPCGALAEFQDPTMEHLMVKTRADAEAWHAELLVQDRDLRTEPLLIPSLQEFLLSLAHVVARSFKVNIDQNITADIMFPFGDVLNHDGDPNCRFDFDAEDMFGVIYTRRNVSKGEELCITYGEKKDNYMLQKDYGFIVPGNPNDRVNLHSDFGERVADSSSLVSIDAEDLHKACERLYASGLRGAAARRVAAAKATLEVSRWPGAATPTEAAFAAVEAYKSRLDSFATTVEEDQALLEEGNLGNSIAAAVRFRLERKLLMRAALDLATLTQELTLDKDKR